MKIGKRGAAVVAVTAATAAMVTGTATADAAAAGHVHSVTVRMTKSAIHLSVGHDAHAGTFTFKAVSADGKNHEMQVARLHKGYSLQQAHSDLNKAFRGDVPAVNRIDNNVTFRGGAPAKDGKPGYVTMNLAKGRYYILDQDGGGLSWLDVHGAGRSANVAHRGWIIAHTYGFTTSDTLPSSGTMRIGNVSDQPHFVEIQHVKSTTTHKQVARFFKHPSGQPSWLAKGSTDSGVISPYKNELLQYNLRPGKYLLACFWPDDETGMPHAFMGMWQLVTIG